MSDQTRTQAGTGIAVRDDGEMVPVTTHLPAQAGQPKMSLSDIARLETGRLSTDVEASYDTQTPEGADMLARHMESQAGEQDKVNDGWYGTERDIIGVTSWAVGRKNNKDGTRNEVPVPMVRTVIEASDGKIMASNSAYVYESLQQIFATAGRPSPKHPVRMRLGKGGGADKMFHVRPSLNAPAKSKK